MEAFIIDISETSLRDENPEILAALLRCHSTWRHAEMPEGREGDFNIIWATDDYQYLGAGYSFHDRITPDLITGDERGRIIRPRVLKSAEEQSKRVKDKAEVFTPSWVCNAQNNLVDEAWFGRPNVFNVMDPITHAWTPTTEKIVFPEGKTWLDYVCAPRMEMCCGEAPYLASRYDTVSGVYIPVEKRIGLLDRKLRVISENVDESRAWINAAKNALKATYGFEWQGDSLLLAREALLYTVFDFYRAKFGTEFPTVAKKYLAYIISWNIFQMDGLKMVIPDSCHDIVQGSLEFDDTPRGKNYGCPGCVKDTRTGHNGIPALLAEWAFDKSLKAKNTKPKVVNSFYQSVKQNLKN